MHAAVDLYLDRSEPSSKMAYPPGI